MTVVSDAPFTESSAGAVRKRSFWLPGLVFLCSAVVYGLTISHGLVSLDVWSANYASWHLVQAGNPGIEGVKVPLLTENPTSQIWLMHTNGHTVIARSPGVVALGLPSYLLLGTSTFSTAPGGLSAAMATAMSVTFVFLTVRRYLGTRGTLLVTFAFGFCTPVWSVAANGVWPHTLTVLGICGMAWASSTGRWWWVGIFGGVTLWGRLHAAVIVALLGLLVAFRRRSPMIVLRVGLASGLFLVLLSAWTRWMYGSWNPTASYDTGPFADYAADHRLSLSNQLGLWIAPDRGILAWTPVILLLVPAMIRSWRDLPDWSRSLVWGGVAYTVLQGVLNRFSGGGVFYGYRLGLEMLACLTPALALSARRMGPVAHLLIGPVLALQFLAIAWGSMRDSAYIPLTQAWHHNAFEVAVRQAGVTGWLTVALALGLGLLVQRMWFSGHDTAGDPQEKVSAGT